MPTTRSVRLLTTALLAIGGLAVAVPAAPAATFTVTTLEDGVPGSLRAAVLNADNTPGADTIDFDVTGTIPLAGSLPNLSDDATTAGPGAASLTIDAQNADRVFSVVSGTTATVSGVTIAHGSSSADGGCLI